MGVQVGIHIEKAEKYDQTIINYRSRVASLGGGAEPTISPGNRPKWSVSTEIGFGPVLESGAHVSVRTADVRVQ